ncbi:MAG: divalent-cation tolerance protein CutA [Pseudomonadota bacterium]
MELMQEKAQTGLICVQTTVSTETDAQKIADALTATGVAACVQITPIKSIYRWDGKIESANEFLLTIKTLTGRLQHVEAYIQSEHPYDEPELIVLPVLAASKGYAAWVEASVS